MELPSINFFSAKANTDNIICPCCYNALNYTETFCPHCNYNFSQAQKQFGTNTRQLQTINVLSDRDPLTLAESKKLKNFLQKLQKHCQPINYNVVFLSPEKQQFPLRRYAHWLLNSTQCSTTEISGIQASPSWTLLLLIDLRNGSTVFAWGYNLDPFLKEETLYPALLKGEDFFKTKNYAKAITTIFTKAQSILIHEFLKACKHIKGGKTTHE